MFFPNVCVLKLGMTRKYNCSTTAVEVVLILQFISFLTLFFYIAQCVESRGMYLNLIWEEKKHTDY